MRLRRRRSANTGRRVTSNSNSSISKQKSSSNSFRKRVKTSSVPSPNQSSSDSHASQSESDTILSSESSLSMRSNGRPPRRQSSFGVEALVQKTLRAKGNSVKIEVSESTSEEDDDFVVKNESESDGNVQDSDESDEESDESDEESDENSASDDGMSSNAPTIENTEQRPSDASLVSFRLEQFVMPFGAIFTDSFLQYHEARRLAFEKMVHDAHERVLDARAVLQENAQEQKETMNRRSQNALESHLNSFLDKSIQSVKDALRQRT